MDQFLTTYHQYMGIINQNLNEYLDLKDEIYQPVIEAMKYSVKIGGKRIRPVLLLEWCRICGGDINKAIPFACAIELIHTYSLIHDDLPCLDDDDYRRGNESCHKKFGEANALLAGDALLTYAFELVSNANKTEGIQPHIVLESMQELSKYAGINGMIGGQVIDIESENKQVSQSVLTRMHSLKTAALIKASCAIGAIVAGADVAKVEHAKDYAQSLGLSFQIVDDILDVTATFEDLGKPIGSDHQNHKTTYVTLLGLSDAKMLANDLSEKAKSTLKEFDDTEFLVRFTEFLLERKN